MFRRRRHEPPVVTDADVDAFVDDLDEEDRAYEDAQLLAELAAREAEEQAAGPAGPWDAEAAPADELPRVDLGGLRVPVPPDCEMRVEVSPEGAVVAVSLVRGQSALQLSAFAAPRREGIWDEVRTEIAAALRSGGSTAEEQSGPFGTELGAEIQPEPGTSGGGAVPARFLGVDGPRWFLRGLLTGPAARSPEQAVAFEEAFRGLVVVRGKEPMVVRDPLPLALPQEVMAAADSAAPPEPEEQPAPRLELPERGPEITEIR